MNLLTLGLTLTELGSGILRGVKAIFSMALTSSLTFGKGTLKSFIRAGAGEATVTDWEGLVKDVNGSEARFKGARRVDNRCTDLVSLVEDNSTVVTVGDIHSVTCNIGGLCTAKWTWNDSLAITGAEFRVSYLIKADEANTGSNIIDIYNGNVVPAGENVQVTTEWKEYATSGTTAVPFDALLTLTGIAVDASGVEADNGDTFHIKQQIEYVSGQANQNPSEYVSVGVGTEPNIQDTYNTFVDGGNGKWVDNLDGTYTGTNITSDDLDEIRFLWADDNLLRLTATYQISFELLAYSGTGNLNMAGGDSRWAFTPVTNIGGTELKVYSGVYICDDVSAFRGAVLRSTGTCTVTIGSISAKEINHGSNVDGVKYFDTLNYNTVVSNVVSTLSAPISADVQKNQDPEFTDARVIPNIITSEDWYAPAGTATVAGGNVTLSANSLMFSVQPGQSKKYYRIEYEISTSTGVIGAHSFGGINIPTVVGKHDLIAYTDSTVGVIIVGGPGISTWEYYRITPLTRIPDDYLDKVLVEDTSQNLQTQSEDDGTWIPARTTRGTNGFKLGRIYLEEYVEDGTITNTHLVQADTVIYTLGVTYTESVYVKQGVGIRDFHLRGASAIYGVVTGAKFDLTLGTIVAEYGTPIDSGIENVGNGIYRCWFTATAVGGGSFKTILNLADSVTDSIIYSGDSTSSLFIGGFQIEASPSLTSYIPTSGSIATRAVEELDYEAPSAFINPASPFSYTARGEFTIPYDGINLDVNKFIFALSETATLHNINIYVDSVNGRLKAQVRHGGVAVYPQYLTELTAGNTYKWLLRYDKDAVGNKLEFFVNGASRDSENLIGDWNGGVNTSIQIGYFGTGLQSSLSSGGIEIYKKALSDTECVELTS